MLIAQSFLFIRNNSLQEMNLGCDSTIMLAQKERASYSAFQTCTVISQEAEAMRGPSCAQATEFTIF